MTEESPANDLPQAGKLVATESTTDLFSISDLNLSRTDVVNRLVSTIQSYNEILDEIRLGQSTSIRFSLAVRCREVPDSRRHHP